VLELAAESNLAAGQKVALQPGSVLVLRSAAINPGNLINTTALTTGGTLSLGVDYSTPLNMATLGNGQLFLGSSGSVSYTASTLGAGAGGVYRLGGGSGASDAMAPPLVLTFSSMLNLFTGPRSVLIGSSVSQSSDVRNSSKVVFSHANNYTLGTTIAAGSLGVGHDNALGSGPLNITGSGGLFAEGGARSLANPIVFGANSGSFTFGGANSLSKLTLTGTVDLGGGSRVFDPGWGTTTFSNTISNGSLILSGGLWSLTGTNTFSGGLTLTGTLDWSDDRQLGAVGAPVTLWSGRLRSSGTLTTTRPLVIAGSGGTIETLGQTLTLTGSISGSLNSLRKEGPGTLILSGSDKSGYLEIKEGTVRFDNSGPNGSMSVLVERGATLGGNGALGRAIIQPGAHLAPGTEIPGTLQVNGGLTLNSGALLDFDLGLTRFDQIILGSGMLDRHFQTDPVVINISNAGGLAIGQSYTLIDWNAGDADVTLGDFQLRPGSIQGDLAFVDKSLQFTVTQIPEPGALPLLMMAGLLLTTRSRGRS
jgi:autotransporter-associated beta strand protein